MAHASISKTKISRKTKSAIIIESVVIISFFGLFYSGIDVDPLRPFLPILLIIYPLGISIGTGIVIASIAETKDLVRWKWGVLAAVITLILIAIMLIFPSIWSGMAFIIAPLMSTAFFVSFMISGETNSDNDGLSRP
jgi:hypothetical protein